MIRISRIAAPIVGVGIATVYAVSVGAVMLAVGATIFGDYEPEDCGCFDSAQEVVSPLSVEDQLRNIAMRGPEECRAAGLTFADLLERGQAQLGHAFQVADCYDEAGDNKTRIAFGRTLVNDFPGEADFYVIKGIAEYDAGKIEETKETLVKGLQVAEDPATLSILHNNYAWALLSSDSVNMNAVDFHSRLALEFDPTECAAIHTRMTFEFAKNINKPRGLRDLNSWIQVREYYGTCLDMFQEPEFQSHGRYALDTISEQVFSTYVMDALLLSDLDVPYDAASYLAPTRHAIRQDGADKFCKQSMALRNEYVQGACKMAVTQAEQHWQNR